VVTQRLEAAERTIADLDGRLRMGKMDAASEERRHNDSHAEVTALMESARGQALNSRKVIARAKNRLLREKCFRYGLADIARRVIQRVLNPRFLR